jgi:hypothetical protein
MYGYGAASRFAGRIVTDDAGSASFPKWCTPVLRDETQSRAGLTVRVAGEFASCYGVNLAFAGCWV